MNTPDHPASHGADASELANEVLGEHAPAGPVSVQRKTLALWLAAAAVGGSLLGVVAMMVTGNSHSQAEISLLQNTIAKLKEESKTNEKQHNELRAAYARMIAEQRCEVIDGLDDCLAAGLMRPERFAASDRQLLEARRSAEPPMPAQAGTDAPAVKATPVPPTAEGATQPAPSAAPAATPPATDAPTRKLSLGEFANELNKIPGVAVEGTTSGKAEAPADGKKGKKATPKPAS